MSNFIKSEEQILFDLQDELVCDQKKSSNKEEGEELLLNQDTYQDYGYTDDPFSFDLINF